MEGGILRFLANFSLLFSFEIINLLWNNFPLWIGTKRECGDCLKRLIEFHCFVIRAIFAVFSLLALTDGSGTMRMRMFRIADWGRDLFHFRKSFLAWFHSIVLITQFMAAITTTTAITHTQTLSPSHHTLINISFHCRLCRELISFSDDEKSRKRESETNSICASIHSQTQFGSAYWNSTLTFIYADCYWLPQF